MSDLLEVIQVAVIQCVGLLQEPYTMPEIPKSGSEILTDLTEKIDDGRLEPGQMLPSYAELADQYHVSPATISRVIAILKAKKLVVGQQGRGVYVRVK